jgi:glutamate/tyrosine decarboxylase-like PLP-dependent enzyme
MGIDRVFVMESKFEHSSNPTSIAGLLADAAARATRYLDKINKRSILPSKAAIAALERLRAPFPEESADPGSVLAKLDDIGSPATIASAGGRYFGYVVGGSLPVGVAASWLAAAWDQNAQVYATSPVAAVLEEVAAAWLLDVLRLPPMASVGFVTGGQMANFTALSAARNAVLNGVGWNFDEHGLFGAPPITILMSEAAHSTIHSAARMMGIGELQIRRIPCDDQGRMRLDALATVLNLTKGPKIVSSQAGNVNSGAFEAFDHIADLCARHAAWLHIDGAFGLWAAATPKFDSVMAGHDRADSWTVDAHKWLNTPYDCGMVAVREARWHRSLKTAHCAYSELGKDGQRDGSVWVPENSRRARGIECWAALHQLGRSGVRSLVERCCNHALKLAAGLQAIGYDVLNEVVLNQVVFACADEQSTRRALARLQNSGVAWLGATTWQGRFAARISVSSWATTDQDVEQTIAALANSY